MEGNNKEEKKLSMDGISETFKLNESKRTGKPPFDELKSLIELVGYEVISIGASYTGFPGAINIQIAPKEYLEQTHFMDFLEIQQSLISSLRECTSLLLRQSQGNG